MARLTVPKKYREGVFKISRLQDPAISQIKAILDGAIMSSRASDKALAEALAEIPRENKNDHLEIASAIIALYGVKAASDVPLRDFVTDVGRAMASIEESEWRIPESEREKFSEKLLSLLSAESFTLLLKATDLKGDDERTFCSARILTDLRPVFGSIIEDGPKGMVIVHLLKLRFHHASQKSHDEIFISLDSDDLQALRKIVERAESKAAALKSAVNTKFFLEQ